MLRIAIEEIPEGVSSFELKCKPEEIDLKAEDALFADTVTVGLKLFRQTGKVFAIAETSVEVELECVRCLRHVYRTLKAVSEVQYLPLPKLAQHRIDDVGIGYYSDEYIDFSDEIRESLLLEIPMFVLCSEDCKGLCPHCGQNLNLGKCSCMEPEEARASGFADLVKSLEMKIK